MIKGKYSPDGDPRAWVPFPSLFGSRWYKNLAQFFTKRAERVTRFRPRLHSLEEYLLVVVYALLKRWSIHQAAEHLNRQATLWFFKRFKRWPKRFRDARKRRFFPHQTSINAFLRSLPVSFVEETFQEFFLAQLREAVSAGLASPNVRLLVDNTRYANYGRDRDEYSIKYHKFPGTDHGHFYQGVLAVTNGVALFTRFSPLARGRSRVSKIRGDVTALQSLGVTVKRVLVDREFYRVLLVKDLKDRGVPVVIPAKNYKAVSKRYRAFLRGRRGLVQPYNLVQTCRKYHSQEAVRVRLAIIGVDDRDPREVREEHLQSSLGEELAMAKLRGFLTTIPPWKDEYAFTRYLCREYKVRWRVESAFRDLNKFAPNWRTNSHSARLFYFGVCAALYNVWQLRSKTRTRLENRVVPVDQALVQQEMVEELLEEFRASRYEREREFEEKHWAAYGFDEKLYA
ncbi:MAG: hypothetical protein ACTSU5_08400 [Promethearchaeota archaeon]